MGGGGGFRSWSLLLVVRRFKVQYGTLQIDACTQLSKAPSVKVESSNPAAFRARMDDFLNDIAFWPSFSLRYVRICNPISCHRQAIAPVCGETLWACRDETTRRLQYFKAEEYRIQYYVLYPSSNVQRNLHTYTIACESPQIDRWRRGCLDRKGSVSLLGLNSRQSIDTTE